MHVISLALAFLAAHAIAVPVAGDEAKSVKCKDLPGLQAAAYHNPEGSNIDTTYSTFDPTVFKSMSPSGTFTMDMFSDAKMDYHLEQLDISNINVTVNYRGYLVAKTTGTYTIEMSGIDDIALFWYGAKAYSGWTRRNAGLVVAFNAPKIVKGTGQLSFDLTEGQYTPIRVIFANADGPEGFQIRILDPSGTAVFGPGIANNKFAVQYGCAVTSKAPAFPAFGSET